MITNLSNQQEAIQVQNPNSNPNQENANDNEDEQLKKYQQLYKTKVCTEKLYRDTLDLIQSKPYDDYEKGSCCSCCITPLSLLIYSIIVAIFTVGGFIFMLSKNKGYKAYKELLERNITIIEAKNKFPNEYESLKLIEYLNRNQDEDSQCSYLLYSIEICSLENYRLFCTNEKYNEGKCNYMDNQYYRGYTFICDELNYKNGQCSEMQYNDYLLSLEHYESKIKYNRYSTEITINLNSLTFEKLWCQIDKYDFPIYLSFLIVLGIFIIFLIFDLVVNKKTINHGIIYYIIITFYMLYYLIFRIYIILYLALFFYSTFVTLLQVSISIIKNNENDKNESLDDLFWNKNGEVLFEEQRTWKDKRMNAIIFCGITLVLFFMIIFLGNFQRLIYNYLSFRFDGKEFSKTATRDTSIKIGGNNYNVKVAQNRDLYLKENRNNKKYTFKEVLVEDNLYYLKYNNLYLRDQLSWSDRAYPKSNMIFYNLVFALKLLLSISFILIMASIWVKDEITYDYYIHLIDIGYKPKKYKSIQKAEDLNDIITDFQVYGYIIIGIVIILWIYIRAILGGFSNIVILWIRIFIPVILALIVLALLVLQIITSVFYIIGMTGSDDDIIKFSSDRIHNKIIMSYIPYLYNMILCLSLFFDLIGLISPLNKIKSEKSKLESDKKTSEDIFNYLSLDNTNLTLKAENTNNNLPKHLFYKKEINQNPPVDLSNIMQTNSKIVCLEKNSQDICDEKLQIDIQFYNYRTYRTLSSIRTQIIIASIIIVLNIASIILSFKSDKNYKNYYDYFKKIDNDFDRVSNILDSGLNQFFGSSILASFTQFWCYLGNYQTNVLISLLIFVILFLLFIIFSILVHKNAISSLKLEYKDGKGILYNILLFTNSIFLIIFKIYVPLLCFLFIYSIYGIARSPNINSLFDLSDTYPLIKSLENEWDKHKAKHYITFVIELIIFSLVLGLSTTMKYSVIDYLNMNYYEEDEDIDEEIDENRNKNKIELNEKTTSIIINNANYNVRTKLNQVLYLQQIGNDKIYKFKKILIENLTNNFVYVRIGPNAIADRISNAEWDFPHYNNIFDKISDLNNSLYLILFFSLPLFQLSLVKNPNYKVIIETFNLMDDVLGDYIDDEDKGLFTDIFNMFGAFSDGINESRFAFYIIEVFIFLLFMGKRMVWGGFGKSSFVNINFGYSIFLIVENSVYFLMTFLSILFGIFSLVCYYKNYKDLNDDDIQIILFLQLVLNFIIIIINGMLLSRTINYLKDVNKLRKSFMKFNEIKDNIDEDEPNLTPIEFKYVSLEGVICSIKELYHPSLQRFLYYTDQEINNNNKMPNINNEEIYINVNNNNNDNNNRNMITQQINSNTDNIIIYNNNNENVDTEKRLN